METLVSSTSFSGAFQPKFLRQKKPNLCNLSLKPLPKSLTRCAAQSADNKALTSRNGWISSLQKGIAALALSMALNFVPASALSSAIASEFDVLRDGPPTESYVVDDAGVLSRVTKSDLKRLLSDLESRKNLRVNFVTVRKLTVSSSVFTDN